MFGLFARLSWSFLYVSAPVCTSRCTPLAPPPPSIAASSVVEEEERRLLLGGGEGAAWEATSVASGDERLGLLSLLLKRNPS